MDMSFGDVMLRDEIDIDRHSVAGSLQERSDTKLGSAPVFQPSPLDRRHTIALQAEEDVCFPQEGLSEIADDELHLRDPTAYRMRGRRRRGKWPDLSILDEWSRMEKEGRTDERRTKKITEPQLINGRLRPVHKGWYRTEEDAPYRFTYFNEDFQSTIHSQTISELVQPGVGFRELFIPDPPLLSDSSDEEDEEIELPPPMQRVLSGQNSESREHGRQPSIAATIRSQLEARRERSQSGTDDIAPHKTSKESSGQHTPAEINSPNSVKSPEQTRPAKPPKYGERPVWWLDVLSPTEAEMKVLSKAFGIHPLTAEDIMVQEQREKVELFRHYYFVNYRTFDQDQDSETFLEPVNMYVVVFREGVLSFHFSMTPHPANVRRRIRQLSDYLSPSSDWISYAIIDDITDVFLPLIQNIEEEVDDIDDSILWLHSSTDISSKDRSRKDSEKSDYESIMGDKGLDMLRRVGDCRKRVMGLYRLLGNKADVIKGFAKRCNEHWEVAPRSEIGLYLGDIQDHIVTMTANLTHYEMYDLSPSLQLRSLLPVADLLN
jgi:magnesium transporter